MHSASPSDDGSLPHSIAASNYSNKAKTARSDERDPESTPKNPILSKYCDAPGSNSSHIGAGDVIQSRSDARNVCKLLAEAATGSSAQPLQAVAGRMRMAEPGTRFFLIFELLPVSALGIPKLSTCSHHLWSFIQSSLRCVWQVLRSSFTISNVLQTTVRHVPLAVLRYHKFIFRLQI